jgi:hypothetical protein
MALTKQCSRISSKLMDGTPGTRDMPGAPSVLDYCGWGECSDGADEDWGGWSYSGLTVLETQSIAASAQAAGTTFATFICRHSASSTITGTTSFQVMTNGNAQNTNNSYGAISDIKLKENIVDANSQWSDIKALQVRNYNFKRTVRPTPKSVSSPKKSNLSPLVSLPNLPTATKTATTLAPLPRASTIQCST